MPKGQPHAIALYDFDTRIEGDLQFKTGDLILLEEVVDEAWYRGRSVVTGAVGIFPMNHVEVRIPLDTGLYTSAQPKPSLVVPPMLNGGMRTRMSSPESRATAKQDSPNTDTSDTSPSSNNPTVLPRRPSRIRISSLCSKFGTPPKHGESNNASSQYSNISVHEANQRFPFTNPPLSLADNVRTPIDPNGPDTPSVDSTRNEVTPLIRSSTPSIIQSLRPRSQVSVSQLAESLEQQGVTVNRVGPMPAGARSLYPSASKLFGSSAPTERSKIHASSETDAPAPAKPVAFPTPHMVETPLVMIARERQRQLANEAKQFVKRTHQHRGSPNQTIETGDSDEHGLENESMVSSVSDTDPMEKNAEHSSQLKTSLSGSDPMICTQNGSKQTLFITHSVFSFDDQFHNREVADPHTVHVSRSNGLSSSPYTFHDTAIDEHKENNIYSAKQERRDTLTVNGNNHRDQTPTDVHPNSRKTKLASHIDDTYQSNGDETPVDLNNEQKNQWLLVLYDYTGCEPGDLTVKAGNVIQCLDPLPRPINIYDVNLPERWLHCVTWFNVEGQVPSTFARRIADPEELTRWMKYRPRAEALFDFDAEAAGDLTLKVGDIIYLHDALDSNWYRGENAVTGERGIFPAPFVHVLCPL